MPNLIEMPRRSYERFLREGLRELFDEISPIDDFTGGRMELRFGEYRFEEPKYSETESRDREHTYAAPMRVRVELLVKETGEVKEQELFMGDIPLMTDHGTFIINGAERVVVSQLVRSPGVYFTGTIDAATGQLVWEYRRTLPDRETLNSLGENKRGIALYEDKIYMVSWDNFIVALDAKTGQVAWESDRGGGSDLISNTTGPIVADGVVVAGSTCQ